MELYNYENTWQNAFKNSKPLISYSMMLGITIDQIRTTLEELICNKKLSDSPLEANVISRMPDNDRPEYEFPQGIQDFVFYEGFQIIPEPQALKLVPLALTSVDSKRKFAMA